MQALNNWGLVLQELSTMRSEAERDRLVRQSVAKFRAAIRLRPEFDRACYNLGTVYYSHAFALQTAAQAALSSQLTKVRSSDISLPSRWTAAASPTLQWRSEHRERASGGAVAG